MKFRLLPLFVLGFAPVCTHAQSAVDTSQYEIGEVTVRTKYHQFQVDSANRMVIYHKVLKDVAEKPGFSVGGGAGSAGVGMTGGISYLARLISGRQKREKKFVADLIDDQQYRFTSLRYTPDLVEKMTGLSGDTASLFMAQNPMPYDYARAASDLEVKMWIRTQYRAWNAKKLAAEPPKTTSETVVARP